MTDFGRSLTILAVAAMIAATGCERSGDPPPRFNTPLGASAGTPRAVAPASDSLLRDPTGYTPASVPPIGSTVATGGGGTADDGADAAIADAVRDSMVRLVQSTLKGELAAALESFNPDAVKALAENSEAMDALQNWHGRIETMLRTVGDKLGSPIELDKIADTLAEQLRTLDVLKVEVQDADHASITLNLTPESLEALGKAFGDTTPVPPEATAMMAASANEALPMQRIGGKWVIPDMGAPITEEQVKQMLTALKAAEPLADRLTQILNEAQYSNMDELQQVLMPQMMPMMMEFMAAMEAAAEDEDDENGGGDDGGAGSGG